MKVMGEPVVIREWQIWGLPVDDYSTENGILATKGQRWPLAIDPQAQANKWMRNMEQANGVKVAKGNDATILRTLENAIRLGSPVLLEDVGEELDPALEPVLQKQVYKQGGRLLIRIGDSDVDYQESFRFYLTTKASRPPLRIATPFGDCRSLAGLSCLALAASQPSLSPRGVHQGDHNQLHRHAGK